MTSTIMFSPGFAEVCFLIALVLFVVAALVDALNTEAARFSGAIVSGGLALDALGLLAL
jgi:cell division protein FtsW (lipid II flippase)